MSDIKEIDKNIEKLEEEKEEIKEWNDYGFFGDEVDEWKKVFEYPQEASIWKEVGFKDPEKVEKYIENDIDDAILANEIEEKIDDEEVDIKELKKMMDVGVTVDSALKLLDIGMNSGKIKAWGDFNDEKGKKHFDIGDNEVIDKIVEWKSRGKVYKTASAWENLFFDFRKDIKEDNELEYFDRWGEIDIDDAEEARKWLDAFEEYKKNNKKDKVEDVFELYDLCKKKNIKLEDIYDFINKKEEVEDFIIKENINKNIKDNNNIIENINENIRKYIKENIENNINKKKKLYEKAGEDEEEELEEKNEDEAENEIEEDIEEETKEVEENEEELEEDEEKKEDEVEEEKSEEELQKEEEEKEKLANEVEEEIKEDFKGVPKKELEDIPIIQNITPEIYNNNVKELKEQLKLSFPFASIRICGNNDYLNNTINKVQFFVTLGENTAVFKVDLGYVEFADVNYYLNPKGKIDLIIALREALNIDKQINNIIKTMLF